MAKTKQRASYRYGVEAFKHNISDGIVAVSRTERNAEKMASRLRNMRTGDGRSNLDFRVKKLV